MARRHGRRWLTHRGKEAQTDDRRAKHSAADAERLFWQQTLQAGPILDRLRDRPYEDAVVVPQARRPRRKLRCDTVRLRR